MDSKSQHTSPTRTSHSVHPHNNYRDNYPGILPALFNSISSNDSTHYSPSTSLAVASGYKALFSTLGVGLIFDRFAAKQVDPVTASTVSTRSTAVSSTLTPTPPTVPALSHVSQPPSYYRPFLWMPAPEPKIGTRFPNYAAWPWPARALGWTVLGLAMFNSFSNDRQRWAKKVLITRDEEVAYANSRLISHR